MNLKITPAIRFVFIVFFLFIEIMAVFLTIQFISKNELGVKESLILAAFALGAPLALLFTRATLFIGDNYIEYFSGIPGTKKITIRAVDVEKIESSAAPYIGRVDYIRMKGGKEMHNIPTDMLERRKEVPALLEKALHTKIIE